MSTPPGPPSPPGSPPPRPFLPPLLHENALRGRVALVTGGGTGLGLEIAREFGRAGASLVIASRDPAHLEAASADLSGRNVPVLALRADVREHADTRRMVRAAVERFGGLDILVNNAAGNFIRPAERLPESAFANVVDIVLNGTFNASRAAARAMMERSGGVILNVVATYAWTGGPGTVHSASAKAGVLAMTRTLAVEWAARGIRVVAIAPGPFDSRGAADRLWPSDTLREKVRRGIPAGRFARRDEVARVCAFLVSDYAAYVTGECLTIDGGGWLGRGILGDEPAAGIPSVRRRRGPARGEDDD